MNITAGVIGSVYYLREERPRPALLHTLGREPNLVGRREELGRLVDRMRPGTGSTGIPIITGMGGIGKTALALATAHAARREGLFTAYYFLDFHGYTAEPNGPWPPTQRSPDCWAISGYRRMKSRRTPTPGSSATVANSRIGAAVASTCFWSRTTCRPGSRCPACCRVIRATGCSSPAAGPS